MPKKQTLEEFIKKSNIAHNFKYNYDKSIYINKQTKVIVTCPEHGDFELVLLPFWQFHNVQYLLLQQINLQIKIMLMKLFNKILIQH